MKGSFASVPLTLLLIVAVLCIGCTSATPTPSSTPTPSVTSTPATTPSTTPAPENVITWTFATLAGATPLQWSVEEPMGRFQTMIKEATGGRLVLNTKLMLVPHEQMADAIIDGRADIGTVWIPFVSGTYPLWDFGSLPFFWGSHPWEYEKAINDPQLLAIMDQSFSDTGLVRLCYMQSSAVDVIFAKKAVSTVDDFQGLKTRVVGAIPTLSIKLLGGAPLVIPLGEVSNAMRLGTVDAVNAGVTFGFITTSMQDAATYINYWPIQPEFAAAICVNQKSWDALPADLQEIVRKVALEFQGQEYLAAYVHDRNEKILAPVSKLTIITPDKSEIDGAAEIVQPAIDEWIKIAGPKGQEIMPILLQYANGPSAVIYKSTHK
jgi:TRAP-type C4-dicarboxylate transport system substrate-binding protein